MSNGKSSSSADLLPPSAQALIERAREMERHFRGCDMAEADLVAELVSALSASIPASICDDCGQRTVVVTDGQDGRSCAACDHLEAANEHDRAEDLKALLSAQQEALAQCQKDRDGQAAREAAICREAAATLSAQAAEKAAADQERDEWKDRYLSLAEPCSDHPDSLHEIVCAACLSSPDDSADSSSGRTGGREANDQK